MATGKVKWFDIKEGIKVSFEMAEGKRGLQALNVMVLPQ